MRFSVLLLSLMLALSTIPFVTVSAQTPILADVINESANAVTYTNDALINRESLTHMGILLGKQNLSDYDVEAQYLASKSDWTNLLSLIRIAEIDGYCSASLQSCGSQALASIAMVDSLPANYQGQYLIYYRNALHGFDYAQRWGTSTSEWNMQAGYDALLHAYESVGSFVWSIDSTGAVTSDNRHYDGAAETLGAFLEFDEMGIPGALAQADNVWNRINSYSWPGYYPYYLGNNGTECEIGFSLIVGEYLERKGSITYEDRLINDIDYKLLVLGWDSADWAPGRYVFCHANRNTEHRLPNTVVGLMVLHSYYPMFNDTMKSMFQQLLLGYDEYLPAWRGLLTTDLAQCANGVYVFRPDNLNNWTIPRLNDTGTAQACLTMFLEGIIPVTGSLNVAKRDELYEDVCSEMSAKDFLFDYANHRIRIPVRAGEIRFQFGSDIASHTFPTSDTYTVQFSSDWNTVLYATRTEPETLVVPDDYPTIQEAINAAIDGDTIFVRNGTFHEQLVLNKTLTLHGQNRNATILDGNVIVAANNVKINGFTVQAVDTAIYDEGFDCCTICENTVTSSGANGIYFVNSSGNLIIDNIVENNLGTGIGFDWSCDSLVRNNTIINNTRGIGVSGISGNDTFSENNIVGNYYGICVELTEPSGCDNFFHNNMINNTLHVVFFGPTDVNLWDRGYPCGGNFWSDYNGTDADDDGIGDTPYTMDANNTDNYPLMYSWSPPDIAVTHLSVSNTILGQGFPISIDATVQNQGSKVEAFTFDICIDGTLLSSENFTLTGGNLSLITIWNTSSFAKGDYVVTVSVEQLQDESNIMNNNVTANVFITIAGDLNGDKIVDIYDAVILANHFRFDRYHPLWDSNIDLNNDGTVNLFDAIILALHYGESWT